MLDREEAYQAGKRVDADQPSLWRGNSERPVCGCPACYGIQQAPTGHGVRPRLVHAWFTPALGETALSAKHWPGAAACCLVIVPTLVALTPIPARADFFDGARRTFQTDIPHFFQDDIPCAFGGQPTSHTKTSCKKSDPPKGAAVKPVDRATAPPAKPADSQR